MTKLFLNIVNMSISASWLILVVLLLRQLFKKVPKWLNVALWGLAGIRLAIPFSIESIFSLIPSRETIPPDIMLSPSPTVYTGISTLDQTLNPIINTTLTPAAGDSANPLQIWISVFTAIWVMGMLFLFSYTIVSYWRLCRRVATAIPVGRNIYQCERVSSPFVLGIIRPRIYLPFHLKKQDAHSIIAHERAHIRRRDHWWKPLGFLLLTVHWFNPLVWIAYVLLCQDIELACDEKVIKTLDHEQRADYSQALLACSIHRKKIAACPLAFGEASVKERVRAVLHYKKPAFWAMAAAGIICAIFALCFLTDPKQQIPALQTVSKPAENSDSMPEGDQDFEQEKLTARPQDAAAGTQNPEQNLPAETPSENLWPEGAFPLEFLLSSGAGSWGTTLTLYSDSHFEGSYESHDNLSAPEYPHGVQYVCRFSGQFGAITQLNEYSFSMQLEELAYEIQVDTTWIEDQMLYVAAEALGVADGKEFILYLPDTKTEGLNEEFLYWWPKYYLWREGSVNTLSGYGIYNVNTGHGFFTL